MVPFFHLKDRLDESLVLIFLGVNEISMLLKELSLWPEDTPDGVLTKLEALLNQCQNNPLMEYLKVTKFFSQIHGLSETV